MLLYKTYIGCALLRKRKLLQDRESFRSDWTMMLFELQTGHASDASRKKRYTLTVDSGRQARANHLNSQIDFDYHPSPKPSFIFNRCVRRVHFILLSFLHSTPRVNFSHNVDQDAEVVLLAIAQCMDARRCRLACEGNEIPNDVETSREHYSIRR